MGFPVLTVTETPTSIHVRQDRFLETGHPEPKDNETLW
jgi:aminopeptidase 2